MIKEHIGNVTEKAELGKGFSFSPLKKEASTMKSWTRSRAIKKSYADGNRAKAKCCVCGDLIYNRMHYRSYASFETKPDKIEYAHAKCSRTQPGLWEPCW
jgi:hypothetical protein